MMRLISLSMGKDQFTHYIPKYVDEITQAWPARCYHGQLSATVLLLPDLPDQVNLMSQALNASKWAVRLSLGA